MQYRRRLRSRIIVSFAIFGLTLTALFAVSAVLLRGWLESNLIGETLQNNLSGYADQFYKDPQTPGVPFEKIAGFTYSERKFANVPFAWRELPNGIHDLDESNGKGGRQTYKLAVRKDPHYWFFLRYDTTQEMNAQRLLQVALVLAVLVFSLLSLIIGFWSSARVMRPVTDLAKRVQALSRSGQVQALKPHFADDEVGQLAAALDEYAERLTHLVERDREFNADVSHELRTPLAVIATTTELLMAQDLPPKVHERLRRIERAVRQSTELTDALLLLSRSERQAPTDGETTDVARVAEQVIDISRPHLGSKPVSVRLEIEQPLQATAPSSVVAVALTNLISNAFKYTQSGEVAVIVGHGRVAVEDTGPGIRLEDAERLFQRGERGTNLVKGAGLGLAIVRRLCELYGWEVSLAPRPQGGAVATLQFDKRS
ncbi:HAMP domain-containing sensor histidine kinase [Dokdonella sp.]|jgi:signal transduction histidine kinase|uniref:sensor histidine kinase n=1 Tax=Dokdonella sp. TaxID=2291710 RepID=UPI001B452581|nr:HAMP domain-containing sensor histidine kinase [Dokdonella sp.]MCC6439454.1 HAMP domain-containing histidine kinase [Rhodanobacteraceae bacterium]MBP6326320.1 HAMP domain-containing histidine kinase [Dokdonella sp.]MBP6329098.1 HAMP domain-containing histidine kinase [Dokdonella sp.]HNV07725.1 HAMP domain-containing sensor histidine kinase [Dokdonella sp.]HPW04175.1 HAMP domain-containing sensor histidine kinase [Dokdonella sp.]